MDDKINREYFGPDAAAFNYNNVTGGADSASGGSGMECLQLRSPPGLAFQSFISEKAKSLVALQELQNEVGALLEFRDLVIETFPNLRSKMATSTPASVARRDWEPGVRVRRKLAAGGGDGRAKPQPSVQDSGFSTETSCKEAHSASAPPAPRPRPLEDELGSLLDVIQRKGVKLRDEVELLRGELENSHSETAEKSFAGALSAGGDSAELARLRSERDALLAEAARLKAAAAAAGGAGGGGGAAPLGRLDRDMDVPARMPRLYKQDDERDSTTRRKIEAILKESNPVELQRQLLFATVQNQMLARKARSAEALQSSRDYYKFRLEEKSIELEEKSIELEGALARLRQTESRLAGVERGERGSMRDLRPLALPGDPAPGEQAPGDQAPRARPSRIPCRKAPAPRPPATPSRPLSSQSMRSARSSASGRAQESPGGGGARKEKGSTPVRRLPSHDSKQWADGASASLVAEYVARTERLAALAPRLASLAPLAPLDPRAPRLAPLDPRAPRLAPLPRTRPLPANLELEYRPSPPPPHNLALELTKSILYEVADSVDAEIKSLEADSLWNGKPQQYFESMKYGRADDGKDFEDDSLA